MAIRRSAVTDADRPALFARRDGAVDAGGDVEAAAWRDAAEDAAEAARDRRARRRSARRGIAALLVLALGAAAYAGLRAHVGDRVPRGASVRGIDIGGLPAPVAEARLREQLVPQLDLSMRLTAEEVRAELVPSRAGLQVDVPATVTAARGGGPDVLQLLRSLFAGEPVEPVLVVDPPALQAELRVLAAEVARAPADGSVTFAAGAQPLVRPAVVGRQLEVESAAAAVESAWRGGDADVALDVVRTDPRTDAADVRRAVTYARRATSAPVRLDLGRRTVLLAPAAVAAATAFVPDATGRLVPTVTVPALQRAAGATFGPLTVPPRDAVVRLERDGPVVVPARVGSTVPIAVAAAALPAAAGAEGVQRRVQVPARLLPPRLSTAGARALRIERIVATATRPLPRPPADPAAAALVDRRLRAVVARLQGRVVRPGATVPLVALMSTPGATTPHPSTPLLQAASAALADAGLRPAAAPGVLRNTTPYGVLVQVRRGSAPSAAEPAAPDAAPPAETLTVRVWSSPTR